MDFGQQVERRLARALDDCDVEFALLGVLLDFRLIERGEARTLQEALHGGVRGADAGALLLLAHVGLAARQAGDVQGETPWRRMGDRTLELQAALDQGAGDEPLQVSRRLPLHAGGDFFGKEFEEEVGHRNRRK